MRELGDIGCTTVCRQTQILQLNDGLSNPEHYYIHVIGKAKNQEACTGGSCADFDYLGSDVGVSAPLDTRPRYIAPILTPHYDEEQHWLAYREYRRLLKAGEDPDTATPPDTGVDPIRPVPTYTWNHRPEYQFSRYSLEIDEINRVDIDPDTGAETKEDIYDTDTPVIGSSDDLIEVLYSLIGPEFDRLTPIDGGQDLILAIGEHETRIEMGEDNTLRFDNIEHLAGLDPEDFLSMRLYLNQDAGNVLWEYAFEHLVLGTQLAEYDPSTGETLYISADDPRVPLEAILIGYAGRENKEPVRVRWEVDGGASLTNTVDIDNEYGIFTNELTMPPNRGAVSTVSVQLLDSSGPNITLPPVEVKAGAPATISVEQPALTVSVAGVDEATLTVTVTDQHGNPVEANTGVGFFVEGSLHSVETSGATDDSGKATLTIKGGDVAEDANVRITAGDVSTNVPVAVKPLNLEFLGLDSTLFAGATDSFTLKVTDHQGNAVPDASITLGSSYGFLSQAEVVTNEAGEATASITAPGSSGSGQLTAQVGRSAWHKAPFDVIYPQMELRDLEVNNAMMVGDTATAGTLNHVRYDTSLITLPYKVSETIRALGDPGDNVTVRIGDFRDPNRAPIAAYYMNAVDDGRVLDETGRYHLNADSVSQAQGTPMGGGRSLRFKPEDPSAEGGGASVLWTESAPALGKLNNLGFSLDLKPANAGGVLVNLGNGAQKLTQTSSGSLVYEIRTTNGTYSVESEPLADHQWHRVAARYHNGQIELWVDGDTHSETANGNLVHNTAATRQLEVGKGFDGQLNSLKWFDWTSQPVMTFDDGSVEKTVTVGADGYTEMTLQSTGVMGAGGSELMTQRIAVHTDKVRQYASLVSREAFATLAGQYADTLDNSAPPINVAGLDPNYQPVSLPFVSKAYAADGESSFAWSLINWFIPIEDFGIVLDQLGYLVSDPEKFDGMEFTIALVNTVTIFPPAKPLKLFTTPLRAMFRSLDKVNPKFAKHFAGYLGKVVQKAKKGDFDTLWNTLPFLVLAAELYSDPDAREGLEFLFSTVDSADDVLSWVNYLGLPANGWEGEGEPPTVPAFGDDPQVSQAMPLGWLVPQAQAAPKISLRRVGRVRLARVLSHLKDHIGTDKVRLIPDGLKQIRKTMKNTSAQDLRRYVFSRELMSVSAGMLARVGTRAFRNIVGGARHTRYSMPALLPMLAYLEYENTCGRVLQGEANGEQDGPDTPSEPRPLESERLGCDGKGFNKKIRGSVYSKLRVAAMDLSDRKPSEESLTQSGGFSLFGSAHGALFHLEQLAFYQAQYRLGTGKPVKDSDAFRYVAFFENDEDVPEFSQEGSLLEKEVIKRKRYVDIILEDGDKEVWLELKSYSAESAQKRDRLKAGKIGQWELAQSDSGDKRGTSLHRQFVIDRAAQHLGRAWLAKNQSPTDDIDQMVEVDDFQWRFQKFSVDDRRAGKEKSVSPNLGTGKNSIRGQLSLPPKVANSLREVVSVSTGLGELSSMNDRVVDSGILATLKTVLPELGYELVKDAVEDVVIE